MSKKVLARDEESFEMEKSFCQYAGEASGFESAAAMTIALAKECWAMDKHETAEALKKLANQFKKFGEDFRGKQRDTGWIKL